MRICFFGTSSAIPGAGNGYTSFVIEMAGRVVLVDTGDNALSRMLALKIDPTQFDAIVLTHEHADHLGSFPALIAALECMNRTKPLSIILPPTLTPRVLKLLELFDYYPEQLHFGLSFASAWKVPGEPDGSRGGGRIELLPGNHSQFTMMVKFVAEEKTLLYTSDIRYRPGQYAVAGGECDAMIHEATYSSATLPAETRHSSALEAGTAARELGVRRLFLCHLQSDAYTSPTEAAEEAAHAFGGSIIIPRLMRWYTIQAK